MILYINRRKASSAHSVNERPAPVEGRYGMDISTKILQDEDIMSAHESGSAIEG